MQPKVLPTYWQSLAKMSPKTIQTLSQERKKKKETAHEAARFSHLRAKKGRSHVRRSDVDPRAHVALYLALTRKERCKERCKEGGGFLSLGIARSGDASVRVSRERQSRVRYLQRLVVRAPQVRAPKAERYLAPPLFPFLGPTFKNRLLLPLFFSFFYPFFILWEGRRRKKGFSRPLLLLLLLVFPAFLSSHFSWEALFQRWFSERRWTVKWSFSSPVFPFFLLWILGQKFGGFCAGHDFCLGRVSLSLRKFVEI